MYASAGSLQQLVDTERGCQDESVLASISFQMLSGLKSLHDRRLIHRDLKPSNILISSSGLIKLTDFGLARPVELDQSLADTFVGSFLYMAPERLSGEPYSFEADVWGIGITIHTVALGHYPYTDSTTGQPLSGYWELLNATQIGPPPSLSDHGFSDAIQTFLIQSYASNATSRASAKDLLVHSFIAEANPIVPIHLRHLLCSRAHGDRSSSTKFVGEKSLDISAQSLHCASECDKEIKFVTPVSRKPISVAFPVSRKKTSSALPVKGDENSSREKVIISSSQSKSKVYSATNPLHGHRSTSLTTMRALPSTNNIISGGATGHVKTGNRSLSATTCRAASTSAPRGCQPSFHYPSGGGSTTLGVIRRIKSAREVTIDNSIIRNHYIASSSAGQDNTIGICHHLIDGASSGIVKSAEHCFISSKPTSASVGSDNESAGSRSLESSNQLVQDWKQYMIQCKCKQSQSVPVTNNHSELDSNMNMSPLKSFDFIRSPSSAIKSLRRLIDQSNRQAEVDTLQLRADEETIGHLAQMLSFDEGELQAQFHSVILEFTQAY